MINTQTPGASMKKFLFLSLLFLNFNSNSTENALISLFNNENVKEISQDVLVGFVNGTSLIIQGCGLEEVLFKPNKTGLGLFKILLGGFNIRRKINSKYDFDINLTNSCKIKDLNYARAFGTLLSLLAVNQTVKILDKTDKFLMKKYNQLKLYNEYPKLIKKEEFKAGKCSLCSDKEDQEFVTLNCGHEFHKKCMKFHFVNNYYGCMKCLRKEYNHIKFVHA